MSKAPSQASSIGREFASPSAANRPMAFWSWNGEITEEGIVRFLDEFRDHGMGGAFVHPRPGLITEYMSERWWQLWSYALERAKRLGLELHIYDENSYPSGFAGGHVVSIDPGTAARRVALVPVASVAHLGQMGGAPLLAIEAAASPSPVAARSVSRDEAARILEAGAPVAAVVSSFFEPRAFTAGFAYVDLTHPDTTRHFLATTYDEYERRVGGDFGGAIKYAFTDEPNPEHKDGFAISPFLLSEFADEHGYRLDDEWAALWFGDGSVRYDYFKTLNRLFLDNFVSPVDRWCSKRKLGFTGHYWEHSWPSPSHQPDNMAAMAAMAVPGNDLLEFQINRSDFWPKAVLNLKELSSVAAQNASRRTMVENGGAGGYDTGVREFRRCDNTLLSFGVTLYAAHLTHYSLAGSRKYEWPQTLGEPASWWKHYRGHADHVARVVGLLTVSTEVNRIALLEPTRTGWLHYCPPSLRAVSPEAARRGDEAMAALNERFTSLVLALFERGIDFDLVEESALAGSTTDAQGRIVVGHRAYDVLALSETTATLDAATAERLLEFARTTDRVVAAGRAPILIDARADDRGAQLRRELSTVADDASLAVELGARVPPRHLVSELPRGAAWHRRAFDDGELLYLFSNSTDEPQSVEWQPEHDRLWELDTTRATATPLDGRQTTAIAPRGLRAFVCATTDVVASWGTQVDRGAREEPRTHTDAGSPPPPLDLVAARRAEPNVLVIDYCDLARRNEELRGVHVLAADRTLWQWAGAAGNAWDRAVQFKRTTLERTYRAVRPRVRYSFDVSAGLSDACRSSMQIVLERAELYSVTVNGTALPAVAWSRWRMEEFSVADVGSMVRAGANTVELVADAFHPLMEIAPLFVLGDFALERADRGFRVVPPGSLGLGDLNRQGLPFYPGEVEYEFRAATGVEVPFSGAYAALSVDGDDEQVCFESPARTAGSGIVRVRVGASAQNLFGPFHSEGLALSITWERSPASQPAGDAYRFTPKGVGA